MKRTTRSSDFTFQSAGHGHYKVTYTSPATGKSWVVTTNDMTLIDATKNSDDPTVKDLIDLKYLCKSIGVEVKNK